MTDLRAELPALEEFDGRLRYFDEILQYEFDGIEASWRHVSSVWDDPVHRRFGEMFDEFRPYIRRYLDMAQEYEAFLSQKIASLRDYSG